jgi:hypothetical protein
MSIQFFPSIGDTSTEFISYAIKRVIFRLVRRAHLTTKFLNAIGRRLGSPSDMFRAGVFSSHRWFWPFLDRLMQALKLLAHRKLPHNSTNNKQQGHDLEYPDQLFSMCGITLFVFVDPLLPRNFIEFAIVRWR